MRDYTPDLRRCLEHFHYDAGRVRKELEVEFRDLEVVPLQRCGKLSESDRLKMHTVCALIWLRKPEFHDRPIAHQLLVDRHGIACRVAVNIADEDHGIFVRSAERIHACGRVQVVVPGDGRRGIVEDELLTSQRPRTIEHSQVFAIVRRIGYRNGYRRRRSKGMDFARLDDLDAGRHLIREIHVVEQGDFQLPESGLAAALPVAGRHVIGPLKLPTKFLQFKVQIQGDFLKRPKELRRRTGGKIAARRNAKEIACAKLKNSSLSFCVTP